MSSWRQLIEQLSVALSSEEPASHVGPDADRLQKYERDGQKKKYGKLDPVFRDRHASIKPVARLQPPRDNNQYGPDYELR